MIIIFTFPTKLPLTIYWILVMVCMYGLNITDDKYCHSNSCLVSISIDIVISG